MPRRLIALFFAAVITIGITAPIDARESKKSTKAPAALSFIVEDINGNDVNLMKYHGKVIMMVNVASECGATPQYKNLQALHDKYSKKGLAIIGFPANNFGRQEPGSNEEIAKFCSTNYGLKFDMMSKISVAGRDRHELFQFLTSPELNPKHGGDVKWNFEKFLIGRDGEVAGRFKTGVNPDDPKVIAVIEAELAKKTAIKAGRDLKVPPAKKNYQGRRVAFTMHWLAADWLTRTARERQEATSVMIKQLKLKPGNVVADIGCGNGYHTLMMAKLVGEAGKVYGVDIQPQMLVFLKRRAQKAGLKNVKPIIGTWINPNLPDGEVDLVMMCDAYHEFSHPVEMLKNIRKSLSPKGRVLLVEFRSEDPNVPIKPDHKMSKKQIMKEMTANGFKLAESFDELPWQHMMFFEKAR